MLRTWCSFMFYIHNIVIINILVEIIIKSIAVVFNSVIIFVYVCIFLISCFTSSLTIGVDVSINIINIINIIITLNVKFIVVVLFSFVPSALLLRSVIVFIVSISSIEFVVFIIIASVHCVFLIRADNLLRFAFSFIAHVIVSIIVISIQPIIILIIVVVFINILVTGLLFVRIKMMVAFRFRVSQMLSWISYSNLFIFMLMIHWIFVVQSIVFSHFFVYLTAFIVIHYYEHVVWLFSLIIVLVKRCEGTMFNCSNSAMLWTVRFIICSA